MFCSLSARISIFVASTFALALVSPVPASTPSHGTPPSARQAQHQLTANQSEAFIENKGQWDSRARFLAQSPGIDSWVTGDGVVYDFNKFVPDAKQANRLPGHEKEPTKGTRYGHVVKMSFAGSKAAQMTTTGELPGKLNYFVGNDRTHWATEVRRFSEAHAEQIYNGISARYYFDNGTPRYDLVVSPGADPSQIQMKFDGADSLDISQGGALRIGTHLGTVEQRGLSVYQGDKSQPTQVNAQMVTDGTTVRFQVGSYDHSKPLVIDPLIFSTYLGGTGDEGRDQINAVAVDPAGGVVVAGSTGSTNFPTTTGAYDSNYDDQHSNSTGFVAGLNSEGTSLVFATYLGGTGDIYNGDLCNGLALDGYGDVIVVGVTGSHDFPITNGVLEGTNQESVQTGFVSTLGSNGASLKYSTYLGGSGTSGYGDDCLAVTTDVNNDIVIAGYTGSGSFPGTTGAFQSTNNESNPNCTGFITKLNPAESVILWSTYLGGSGASSIDQCTAVASDDSSDVGNVVVAGTTTATNFPTTAGALETSYPGTGRTTGFVAKINGSGTTELFGTYLGGNGTNFEDVVQAVTLDASGNVFVAGSTGSTNFPTTSGALQTANPDPLFSGFVSELSPGGTALLASTYLGGNGSKYGDQCNAIALDSSENVVVTGYTGSGNFPTTSNAYLGGLTNSQAAGFVDRLNPALTTLEYGTYLGGNLNDQCYALTLDTQGNPVVAGSTFSTNFPTSLLTYQSTNKNLNYGTGFVTKLSLPATVTSLAFLPSTLVGGQDLVGSVQISIPAGPSGIQVFIHSANTNYTEVPLTVTVPAGSTSATFTGLTAPVASATPVAITASYDGSSQTNTLDISPPTVSFFVASPNPVVGGQSSTGIVHLSGPAAQGGYVVSLSSNMSTGVVPATVTVPAGATAASFPITTKAVSTSTVVTLTATSAGSQYASLTVTPPTLSFLLTTPTTIECGQSSTGIVFLTGPAGPSGDVVSLSSSNAAAKVPATVTVPAGSTAASFTITTAGVATTTTATLTARYNSSVQTSAISVTPATVGGVSVASSSVVGGASFLLTINLTGPAGPSGDSVAISTGSSPAVTIPATELIPADKSTATFDLLSHAVSATTTVTITATFNSTSQTTTLTVNEPGMSSFSVASPSVVGGTSVNFTLSIAGLAGPSGDVVSLASSSTAVTMPASETVAAGTSSITFSVPTKAVSANVTADLVATIGSSTKSTTLVVTVPTIASFTLGSSSVVGGVSTTGTVTLSGIATTGGDVVKITSSSTDATVPATVTVVAGATSIGFQITTKPVTVSTPVTITATYGASVVTKTLTLTQ